MCNSTVSTNQLVALRLTKAYTSCGRLNSVCTIMYELHKKKANKTKTTTLCLGLLLLRPPLLQVCSVPESDAYTSDFGWRVGPHVALGVALRLQFVSSLSGNI